MAAQNLEPQVPPGAGPPAAEDGPAVPQPPLPPAPSAPVSGGGPATAVAPTVPTAAPPAAPAPPPGTPGPANGRSAAPPVPAAPVPAPAAPPSPPLPAAAPVAPAAPSAPVLRYQHLPIQAPLAVPTVAPELSRAQGRPRSGGSAAARAGRSLRRLVTSAASETQEVTGVAAGIRQPVTAGRHIAVSSIRGGAGKTTVAALLGLTYAHYRRDAVLTLEADPALGTLPIRLGADAIRWTCGDVARIVAPSMQLTDITGYLVQVSQGGWLLPGSQGTVGVRLELAEYARVMTALRDLFGITVVDCETLPAELARAALHAAHARVLVAPATVEGVMSTRSVLDWMMALPRPMLPSTVVVLTQSSPDMTLDLGLAARHLGIAGATVLVLPYDRHLAAGGAIRTSLLGRATRDAVTRLAADLLDRALHTPR